MCQFQRYSKVNHLHTHPPVLKRFFFHRGHYRVLKRVPCAIQQVLFCFNIYLFGCAGSLLPHVGSSVFIVACEIFQFWHADSVAACGIQFSDWGLNSGPCIGSVESQPLDCGGVPYSRVLLSILCYQQCVCYSQHSNLSPRPHLPTGNCKVVFGIYMFSICDFISVL